MFPLHLAALSGFSDCCRKLLSSGKIVSALTKHGLQNNCFFNSLLVCCFPYIDKLNGSLSSRL